MVAEVYWRKPNCERSDGLAYRLIPGAKRSSRNTAGSQRHRSIHAEEA